MLKSRRVLLHITDSNGGFITSVIDDGQVYLHNLEHAGPLRIQHSDDQYCQLSFEVPDEQDLESYFETLNANCAADAESLMAVNGSTR